MDEHPRIEPQRRHLEKQAEDLLERVPFMEEEELRWTIRFLRDCLPPPKQAEMLRDYSEHLDLHQMRHVVEQFVSRYTEHALEALDAKRFTTGQSLRDMTDEELQAMSAAEKWDFFQSDPEALQRYQVRQELARLFMCFNFDLFHDTLLAEAAIEFSTYLDLVERLDALPDHLLDELKAQAIAAFRGLNIRDVSAVEAVLAALREAIGRAAGLRPPFEPLFTERMERWPATVPGTLPDVVNTEIRTAVEEMNLQQLQASFRVLTELMSLEEQQRELEPLKGKYRSLADIPGEQLTTLLPQLSMRLGDRNVCDFALRYRSGRLWARDRVSPQAWKLFPFQEKFMLLEADNDAMDLLQASRHLTRILLTERYELLFDPAHQVALTHEPLYRRLVDYCMMEAQDREHLQRVNRQVTRMMLELEQLVPEGERPGRFLDIQEVIGKIVKIEPTAEQR